MPQVCIFPFLPHRPPAFALPTLNLVRSPPPPLPSVHDCNSMGASRGVPSPPARRCNPIPYHMVFNHRLRAALYQCGFIWRPITVAGGTERDARCGHRLGLVFRLRAEPRDGESDAPRPGRDVREPRFHQGALPAVRQGYFPHL